MEEADGGRERAGEASCHQVLPLHADVRSGRVGISSTIYVSAIAFPGHNNTDSGANNLCSGKLETVGSPSRDWVKPSAIVIVVAMVIMVDITIVIIDMMITGVAMELVKEVTKCEHYDLNIPP